MVDPHAEAPSQTRTLYFADPGYAVPKLISGEGFPLESNLWTMPILTGLQFLLTEAGNAKSEFKKAKVEDLEILVPGRGPQVSGSKYPLDRDEAMVHIMKTRTPYPAYNIFGQMTMIPYQKIPVVFAGRREIRYPCVNSTHSSMGPLSNSYTVTESISKTHSETSGWSVGGKVGVKISKPGGGDASGEVSYTYSQSSTNSTTWLTGSSETSNMTVEKNQWGRIDVFAAGGYYNGYVFFDVSKYYNSEHNKYIYPANSIYPCLVFNKPYLGLDRNLFFVKSPNAPHPTIWLPRLWKDGEIAPSTDFPYTGIEP
ncbi:hypothetical protein [Streptosporangium sp. NPDC020145]|uniref:hypothetical protein n=1 Tax=Streptosporangium sp. NPDC020145 TaxID=3154694 RepID=UPI00343824B6